MSPADSRAGGSGRRGRHSEEIATRPETAGRRGSRRCPPSAGGGGAPPPRMSAALVTPSRIGIPPGGCKGGILCDMVGNQRENRAVEGYYDMKKRILLLLAHPDDETFGPGGTIAKYADEGAEIYLATATRGEVGMVGDPPFTDRAHLGDGRAAGLPCAAGPPGVP